MIALGGLIMAAVIFAVTMLVEFLLEGKPSKVRIPIFALIIIVSVCGVLSYSLYTIGKRITFPGANDEDAPHDDSWSCRQQFLRLAKNPFHHPYGRGSHHQYLWLHH